MQLRLGGKFWYCSPQQTERPCEQRQAARSQSLAASVALAACAASPRPPTNAAASAAPATAPRPPAATPASQLRDLTPQEKKIIVDAVAPSLEEPGAAKYKWTKFPIVPPSDEVSYCATVDAKSPYAAYNGHQAYIVDTKVVGGHITSAALGLITGGKDTAIVANMCATHGLDPTELAQHTLEAQACGVHSSALAPASDCTRASSAASSRAGPE